MGFACFKCKTEMKCVDDVNEHSFRADFFECPNCKSELVVIYDVDDHQIKDLHWKRSSEKQSGPKSNIYIAPGKKDCRTCNAWSDTDPEGGMRTGYVGYCNRCCMYIPSCLSSCTGYRPIK